MTSPEDDGLPEGTKEEVERFLSEKIVEHEVPGASVAVVDRDGVAHAAGIGARDVEPVDGTHVEVAREGGPEFSAFPESVAHDDYEFYAVRATGLRPPVRFRETDDGMELRFDKHRLDRTTGG